MKIIENIITSNFIPWTRELKEVNYDCPFLGKRITIFATDRQDVEMVYSSHIHAELLNRHSNVLYKSIKDITLERKEGCSVHFKVHEFEFVINTPDVDNIDELDRILQNVQRTIFKRLDTYAHKFSKHNYKLCNDAMMIEIIDIDEVRVSINNWTRELSLKNENVNILRILPELILTNSDTLRGAKINYITNDTFMINDVCVDNVLSRNVNKIKEYIKKHQTCDNGGTDMTKMKRYFIDAIVSQMDPKLKMLSNNIVDLDLGNDWTYDTDRHDMELNLFGTQVVVSAIHPRTLNRFQQALLSFNSKIFKKYSNQPNSTFEHIANKYGFSFTCIHVKYICTNKTSDIDEVIWTFVLNSGKVLTRVTNTNEEFLSTFLHAIIKHLDGEMDDYEFFGDIIKIRIGNQEHSINMNELNSPDSILEGLNNIISSTPDSQLNSVQVFNLIRQFINNNNSNTKDGTDEIEFKINGKHYKLSKRGEEVWVKVN